MHKLIHLSMKPGKNNKIRSLSMPPVFYTFLWRRGRMKWRVLRVLIRKMHSSAKAIQMLDCDEGRGEERERDAFYSLKRRRKKSIFLLPWRAKECIFFSKEKKLNPHLKVKLMTDLHLLSWKTIINAAVQVD